MDNFTVFNKEISKGLTWNINTGYLQEVTEKMIKGFQSKKDEIIKERMIALGLCVDFGKIKNKRFSRLLTVIREGEETMYYDDGSDEGLRIVTFVTETTPPTMELDRCFTGLSAKYY